MFLYLEKYSYDCRAKANKRKRVGESSSSAAIPESQDPPLVTPEVQTETTVEDNPDQRVEPTQQNEPAGDDELVIVEPVHMDAQGNTDDPAHNTNPPSPTRASSPVKEAENIISPHTVVDEEVNISGETYKALEASNTLAKFMAKDKPTAPEKGKAKLELPHFEDRS